MRKRWFKPRAGGPLRAVSNRRGNYAGNFTTFKPDPPGRPRVVTWESITQELVTAKVLERARDCTHFVEQAEQHEGLTIDMLSFWLGAPNRLHYVKPAEVVSDSDVSDQLKR